MYDVFDISLRLEVTQKLGVAQMPTRFVTDE